MNVHLAYNANGRLAQTHVPNVGETVDNILIELDKSSILSSRCERALLIGLREGTENILSVTNHVEELKGLVLSLGIPVQDSLIVKLREFHPHYLLGRGKVEEIHTQISDDNIDLVVFDVDLSPTQQRNLEKEWNTAVIDRREVILDIFSDRANTREAVLQVALARMQYSLPRLTRAWTHLSRQRGGARGNRGKGETQLETDRRLVMDKIARLKRDLTKVRAQREVRRKKRVEKPVPSVSLVGYTNAGKSSVLNAISGANVYAENKLFATLDPTTRKISQSGGREFLLTDTVGFIRKLPHDLIEAFHSTLEEAILSDVILHVADAGSSELEEHITVTRSVLDELGAKHKPYVLVLNKIDTLSPQRKNEVMARFPDALAISARSGYGLDMLVAHLGDMLDSLRTLVVVNLPPDRWDLRSQIHKESTVLSEEYHEEGIKLSTYLSKKECQRLAQYVVNE